MNLPLLGSSVVIGLGAGFLVGWMLTKRRSAELLKDGEFKAKELLLNAERKEQDVLQRAKEKAIKILEESRVEEKKMLDGLKTQQLTLLEREQSFSQKLIEFDQTKATIEATKTSIETTKSSIESTKQEIEHLRAEQVHSLERMSGLSRDQALDQLMSRVELEQQDALMSRMRKLDEIHAEEIDRKAKNILSLAIQRQASSHVAETTTTYVELPTEEMKGRIIGREGRNLLTIREL